MNISTNKSRLRKIWIYFLIVILFIAWLQLSNDIMARLSGKYLKPLSSEDFADLPVKEGYSAFDKIVANENSIFEELSILGWAFVPTLEDNSQREVQLIFMSEENGYSIELSSVSRAEVVHVFSDMFGENRTDFIGYEVEFSTANMKDGIYSAYFYCKENDTDFGLVDGDKKFIKEGKSFSEYIFQSEEAENLVAQKDLVYSVVDKVSGSDSTLEIVGWGFIENMDCSQQTVYVKLDNGTESRTYTTEQKTRSDVAKSYKNEQYAASGYRAEIPLKQLGAGSYQLELFVKNGDTIASAIKGTVQIAEDGDVSYTTAKDIIKTFESEKVENLIAQEDLVYSSVDLVSNNNTMLEIVGWGFIENMDCSQQTVYVKLDNGTESETYTTEQKTRSDVAESYKNEQYAASGYSAEIPLEQLGAGSYQLELFVKNGDTIASAIKGTVQIAEDGTIMYTKA